MISNKYYKAKNEARPQYDAKNYYQKLSERLVKIDELQTEYDESKHTFVSYQREIEQKGIKSMDLRKYGDHWHEMKIVEGQITNQYEKYRAMLAVQVTNLRKEPLQQKVWLKNEKLHHLWQVSMLIKWEIRQQFDRPSSDFESNQLNQLVNEYAYNVKYLEWNYKLQIYGRFSFAVIGSDDGRYLFTGSDNQISVWDLSSNTLIKQIYGHNESVQCLDYRYGRLVSGSGDNSVRIWDAYLLQSISILYGHTAPVYSVTFNTRGDRIVSGSEDNTVRLWSVINSQCIQKFDGHKDSVYAVHFLGDTSLISGSLDKSLIVWDYSCDTDSEKIEKIDIKIDNENENEKEEKKNMRTITDGVSGPIGDVRINCDSSLMACIAEDQSITVYSLPDLEVVLNLAVKSFQCRFHPSNPHLLAVGESRSYSMKVYDVDTGVCLRVCNGHTGSIVNLCWSADGTRAISASADGSIRVWDLSPVRLDVNIDEDPLDYLFYGSS